MTACRPYVFKIRKGETVKQSVFIFLSVFFVLCSACTQAVPPDPTPTAPISTPALPNSTTAPQAPSHTQPGESENFNKPDEAPAAPPMPYIPEEAKHPLIRFVDKAIVLEYEITRPPDAFFSAMNNMSDKEYLSLRDQQRNFLRVDGFVIFSVYDHVEKSFKIV